MQKSIQYNLLYGVQKAIDLGINLNQEILYMITPICHASNLYRQGNIDFNIIKLLVDNGANIKETVNLNRALENIQFNLLLGAVYNNDKEALKYLYDNDINVNNSDPKKEVLIECLNRNFDILEYLIKMGAELNNEKFITKLLKKDSIPLVKKLMKLGFEFDVDLLSNIFNQLNIKSKKMLIFLLKNGKGSIINSISRTEELFIEVGELYFNGPYKFFKFLDSLFTFNKGRALIWKKMIILAKQKGSWSVQEWDNMDEVMLKDCYDYHSLNLLYIKGIVLTKKSKYINIVINELVKKIMN